MIKRYFVRSLPEWALCVAAGAALCGNVLEGFILPEELYTAWLPMILLSMVLLAVLYAISYSRKTILIGIPLLLAAAVLAVVVCGQRGISLLETAVAEDNTGLWGLVCCVTVLVVFCLTRTAGGTAVLCLFGTLANGWICLSLYPFSVPCLVVFLVSSLALLALVRYRRGMLLYSTKRSGWNVMAGISLAMAGASVLLGSVLWFGLIAPMNPPTQDVNLLTKIVSLEVLERIGVSKTEILLDENQYSDEMDEDFDALTDEMEEETEDELEEDPEEEAGSDQYDEDTPVPEGVTQALRDGLYGLIEENPALVILLGSLLVLLVAAAIACFLLRHRLWVMWLQRNTPDRNRQADILYHRLRRKLPLLGMPSAGTDTPLEYAERIQRQTALLDEDGMSWMELSEVFSRLCYGGIAVTEEECEGFLRYYRNFCRQAGKLRRFAGLRV